MKKESSQHLCRWDLRLCAGSSRHCWARISPHWKKCCLLCDCLTLTWILYPTVLVSYHMTGSHSDTSSRCKVLCPSESYSFAYLASGFQAAALAMNDSQFGFMATFWYYSTGSCHVCWHFHFPAYNTAIISLFFYLHELSCFPKNILFNDRTCGKRWNCIWRHCESVRLFMAH